MDFYAFKKGGLATEGMNIKNAVSLICTTIYFRLFDTNNTMDALPV
jgi:hypothetical protein